MDQAKDSGSIEQDANVFMILWPVPQPQDMSTEQYQIWDLCRKNGMEYQGLIVAKNRQGRTGFIDLAFNKPRMTFKCITRRQQ